MLCEHQNTSPCFECDVESLEIENKQLRAKIKELEGRVDDGSDAWLLRKQAEAVEDFLEWANDYCSGWAQDDAGRTYWHDAQIRGFAQRLRQQANELEQLQESE